MLWLPLVPLCAFTITSTAQYTLQSNFTGPTFFDNFNFSTDWDHSFGYVHYLDRPTAAAMNLFNTSNNGPATFGVDSTQVLNPGANLGRASLRLVSYDTWQHGLFIVDLAHMPDTVCGVWPALWMVGNGVDVWPANGEIDIIEYLNLRANNSLGLHTLPGCSVAGSQQRGTILTNDCGASDGVAGCLMSPASPNNIGTAFNDNGGGVYAIEWTAVAIRIWFFPRDAIPADITSAHPSPFNWGLPDGNFEGGCNINSYFFNMSLVFNTDFCGSWAGPTFVKDGCPALDPTNSWSSCNQYVAYNPKAFVDAYWAVNYLEVYQTEPGTPPPPSSVLSSVIPAASTSAVSSGAPEGVTTTSSSLLPSLSTSSTSSASLSSSTNSTSSTSTSVPLSPSTTLSLSVPIETTVIIVTTVITITPVGRRPGSLTTVKMTIETPVVVSVFSESEK